MRVAWWVRGTPPRAATTRVVDAADADRWVGQVDQDVSGLVESGQRGSQGDGFAGADLAGEHAEGALLDAPGDAGGGLVMGVVAVQHAGGEFAAERHAGEAVVGLQVSDHGGLLG